jgi:hypothetical protein
METASLICWTFQGLLPSLPDNRIETGLESKQQKLRLLLLHSALSRFERLRAQFKSRIREYRSANWKFLRCERNGPDRDRTECLNFSIESRLQLLQWR